MKSFSLLGAVILVIATSCLPMRAQQSTATTPPPKGVVVEVTSVKGRPLAYQRVGEWSWYTLFGRPAEWKPREGELPIAAVKVTPRAENGTIRARVTVLRGKLHEVEDFVADHVLSAEKPTVIRELVEVGVEPFELLLVRAPSTIADLPTVVNKTRSLQVSVEPAQSSLPTFKARVLNSSTKPVSTVFFYTSVDGEKKMSGSPRNEDRSPLIKPGDTYERTIKYPMKLSTASTGEVPPAVSNLVLNVNGVVFTDGTYEGEADAAATFLAIDAGEKAQLRRFLDLIRSKEFTNSPDEIAAAIASVNVDAVAGELSQRFPTLTAEEKARLRDAANFGKSLGVKLFRSANGEPAGVLAERIQKRIDVLQ